MVEKTMVGRSHGSYFSPHISQLIQAQGRKTILDDPQTSLGCDVEPNAKCNEITNTLTPLAEISRNRASYAVTHGAITHQSAQAAPPSMALEHARLGNYEVGIHGIHNARNPSFGESDCGIRPVDYYNASISTYFNAEPEVTTFGEVGNRCAALARITGYFRRAARRPGRHVDVELR